MKGKLPWVVPVPWVPFTLAVLAAELVERAVPPLWPLYPPGRSPLHHAQQLQLFSQQHFLRQQELLYLQQQAAQALELQRSAQLVVSSPQGLRKRGCGMRQSAEMGASHEWGLVDREKS